MILKSLKAVRSAEIFIFSAIFTGVPGGAIEVMASSKHLRTYGAFQRRILEATGLLFLFAPAEGMEPKMADFIWRDHLARLLTVIPAELPAAGNAPTVAEQIGSGKSSKLN